MQDRFVGDVGDFGKYGRLRALCSPSDNPPIRLGVIWYRVPNETHNDDGKHTGYLQTASPKFRDCDPELYDTLRKLLIDNSGSVMSEQRRVATIESSTVLPSDTLFYNEPLAYKKQMSAVDRLSMRKEWFRGAQEATASAQLIFFDPDNGVECKSVIRTRLKGPKYVFWDDLESFSAREQSLVVYHHFNFSSPATDQVTRLLSAFRSHMPENYQISSATFTRGARRAFFLAAAPKHSKVLANRLSSLFKDRWGRHFIR